MERKIEIRKQTFESGGEVTQVNYWVYINDIADNHFYTEEEAKTYARKLRDTKVTTETIDF